MENYKDGCVYVTEYLCGKMKKMYTEAKHVEHLSNKAKDPFWKPVIEAV